MKHLYIHFKTKLYLGCLCFDSQRFSQMPGTAGCASQIIAFIAEAC